MTELATAGFTDGLPHSNLISSTMKRDILATLAAETNQPCVTISMITHRTHPENVQDAIVLKNLCTEAEHRVLETYPKRSVAPLLEKLAALPKEIDPNYNLSSLHVFLSNDTKEVVRSTWPTEHNLVFVDDTFAIRPLIKEVNRTESYVVMVLSLGGVHLYQAENDAILHEIRDDIFPIKANTHYYTMPDKLSDNRLVENAIREYFNEVDKGAGKHFLQTKQKCVVICTEDNYNRLLQLADRPSIYYGFAHIDYNQTSVPHLAEQAWAVVKEQQRMQRAEAIGEMKAAVSQGKVLTDLQEIFRAAKDGRGELLIVHNNFSQAVRMVDDYSFQLVDDPAIPGVVDDITSLIGWEVMLKHGRTIFTSQDEIADLGPIALKVRY